MISRVALFLGMALALASAAAQNPKPKTSTQNSVDKQKHSSDEIADWIISHATIEGMITRKHGWIPGPRTVVTKYPNACTLRIKTTYSDALPEENRELEEDFKVPVASIDLDKLAWQSGGLCAIGMETVCTRIVIEATNDKQPFYVFRSYDSGVLDGRTREVIPPRVNESRNSEWFYVQDDAMAKRLVAALTDLIVQCGGKPPKKEIY